MPKDKDSVEIVVCLGSSCFARGNSENLAILNKQLQSSGLNASVHLAGRLCEDQCKQGPNLTIGGVVHQSVTPERLRELIQKLQRDHEANLGPA
jgi:NADH:ubiquinone oxidoreductase subunit E